MLTYLKKFKALTLLLIAGLLFSIGLTGAALKTRADSGPLSVNTDIRNKTDDTAFSNRISAKPGDEVTYRIYVKNLDDNAALKDATVKIQLSDQLEYIPGTTQVETGFHDYKPVADGITASGVTVPELQAHGTAYFFFGVKVKASATGTLNQTTTFSHADHTATDTTAVIAIGGSNAPVAPKMVVDTKAVNLGTNPHPGEYPDRDWTDTVTAKNGDTVAVYVYTYNNQPAGVNSVIKDVKTTASVSDTDAGFRLVGTSSAANHATLRDGLTVKTGAKNLEYVNGSARVYFFDRSGKFVSAPLPDSVMSTGINTGDVQAGGDANGRFVYFQMKLTGDNTGTLQLEKHVYKNGGWLDEGTQDADKQVDFIVTYPDGTEKTIRTNLYGSAELNNVPFGNYKVREIVPTGYTQVELVPGEFTLSKDRAVQKVVAQNKQSVTPPTPAPKGNLTIVKFEDKNGNGKQDAGEGPMADVTFTVTGPDSFNKVAKTNTDGKIELTDLKLGNYVATESVPTGYEVTTANPQTGEVKANATAVLKFGNKKIVVAPQKGNLIVIKFEDKNGNGVQDANEGPLANVNFTVTGPNGYSNTAATNTDGKISLTNLTPGQYRAVEQVPANYRATTPTTQDATVKANETATLKFGNQKLVTLTPKGNLKVVKFEDKNGNGKQDAGEGPMADINFTVTGPENFTTTLKTNAAGIAELQNLVLGNYTATEQVPADFKVTTANPQVANVEANKTAVVTFGNQRIVVTPPTPSPTPTPQGGSAALQINKYVGNATRNESVDKTATKAFAGETVNWRVVVKNVGSEVLKNLRLSDMLPANVKVSTDFVITNNGQKARLADFTKENVLIGDLTPGQEVTVEFGTVVSRDVVCGNELVNTAFAQADNHMKVQSQAKVSVECLPVAGVKQPPLVKTGSAELFLSTIASMLALTGYIHNRQRKQLAQIKNSF